MAGAILIVRRLTIIRDKNTKPIRLTDRTQYVFDLTNLVNLYFTKERYAKHETFIIYFMYIKYNII